MMCYLSNAITPRVILPKGYYLKVSGSEIFVGLYDKQGKQLIKETAQEFAVHEPYVAIWGNTVVYFLNTDSGEISTTPCHDYNVLWKRTAELGFGNLQWSDCVTFWDIRKGYKPITWTQQ